MRAIDADALKKCVLKWLPQDPCGKEEKKMPFETDICVSMLMEIDEQPTIQPKRGHWIKADVCGNTTSWECSCCHNWTGLPTGWNVKAKLWFCPKCTADMRSEQNG